MRPGLANTGGRSPALSGFGAGPDRAARNPGHLDLAARRRHRSRQGPGAGADAHRRGHFAQLQPNVTDTLFQHLPGVSTSDQQGNSFQTDIRYRGFVASPVPGQPQGLAVYMNGMRINEAFGDTVNFDFIPTNAIDRADIQSNNPVFGLNALGGAINFQMKNGFTYQGFEAELLGGSYGRISSSLQFGMQQGRRGALHRGAGTERNRAGASIRPARLARVYADVGWRHDGNEVHLVLSRGFELFRRGRGGADRAARNAIGPRPTRGRRRRRTRTSSPRSTASSWSPRTGRCRAMSMRVQFKQAHLDGNGADVERCSAASSFPNRLCLEDDGFPRPTPVTPAFRNQFVVLDQNNNPIPCPPGAGNTCATGALRHDRPDQHGRRHGRALRCRRPATRSCSATTTASSSAAASTTAGPTSPRRARSRFINPDLSVTINPAIPGNGQIIHTLGNLGFIPVNLDAQNTYFGLYATDTFDITSQLSVTVGGRLNVAKIKMADLTGVVARPQQRPHLHALQSAGRRDLQGRARAHASMAAIRNRTARRRRSRSAAPIRTGRA